MLRLASPLDQLFRDWLETHYPERATRVLGRIRECRVYSELVGHRLHVRTLGLAVRRASAGASRST